MDTRYLVASIACMIYFSPAHSAEEPTRVDAMTMTITCRDNAICLFRDEDMTIDIVLKNSTCHYIGFPLDYLRRKGVYCLLTDNTTHKAMEMGISLTPPAMRRKFINMAPGAEFVLSHRISALLIRSFGGEEVDITASMEVAGLLAVEEGHEPVQFLELGQVTIRSQVSAPAADIR